MTDSELLRLTRRCLDQGVSVPDNRQIPQALEAGAWAIEHALHNANCSNCVHFDGDCHCSLPIAHLLVGHIVDPKKVSCARWMREDDGYGHGV